VAVNRDRQMKETRRIRSKFHSYALTAAGIAASLLALALPPRAQQKPGPSQDSGILGVSRVDRDLIYGMYSGLALLMDVYHPAKPNGFGVIYIFGSGWSAPLDYGARPLKNSAEGLNALAFPLVQAGYTVFAIDHRALPRFHWPAQIEDAQRAVRFVRYRAKQFGINPARIGAVGYSSGAHIAGLLGMMPGAGDANDSDPVEQQSARVQCVIGAAMPSDLSALGKVQQGMIVLAALLGKPMPATPATSAAIMKQLDEASPIHFAKSGAPPTLLIHGDADEVVPFEQSQQFEKALEAAHVQTKLITVRGGTHQSIIQLQSDEYRSQLVQWMDEHLREAAGAKRGT
jgi:acetyl esterase/lipase